MLATSPSIYNNVNPSNSPTQSLNKTLTERKITVPPAIKLDGSSQTNSGDMEKD